MYDWSDHFKLVSEEIIPETSSPPVYNFRIPHGKYTFTQSPSVKPTAPMPCKSHDSSVGTALGYGLDDQDSKIDSRRGLRIFLFATASRTALRPTQPPIQWVLPVTLFLGVKWPGREADHSLPSSAEVKK
jgi:hypothetical protein